MSGASDSSRSETGDRRTGSRAGRQDVLDAAVAVVAEHGASALTTGRIAKRAGIVQSGFYAHFPNIAACVEALEERIETQVREPIADGMERLRETGPGDAEALTAYFLGLIDLVRESGALMDVFMRFRGDPSPLGAALDRCEAALIDDLTDHLDAFVATARDEEAHARACRAVALLLVRQAFDGMGLLRAGTIEREPLARLLAEQTSKIGASASRAGLFAQP
ncbi:TetR family transcriptional regulator [Hasllibacter halocynthiae]|uniref:TetR family transcriptional regulator n=1 Tax=Hasllibacter halocynthiae TaxID=595589 RepID=A0A2T0X9Z1_9RHOB|nr:TetR/AcrR family transcriptional regulator [Hasllibacter halocynthiae]PRY95745.1 TetR family transcriptional regulator [Hasllibacter halocynthiae]